MQFETIPNNVAAAADFHKYDAVPRKDESEKKTEKEVSKKYDNASISSESRNAADVSKTIKTLAPRVESYPDIREEKVNEVREKLKGEYYNSQEFADNLASRLIEDLRF